MRNSLQRGVTLIELVIGLAIVSILIAAGLPSFTLMMQNAQVRTAADSLQNGLQLARAQAVRRNTLVRFQLMSSVDNSCALTTAGRGWVVSLNAAAGQCATPPAEPPPGPLPAGNPWIIEVGSLAEGAGNAVVASNATGGGPYAGALTFNGWGRISTADLAAGTSAQITISNPTAGTCADAGGTVRCLRLLVSSGGEIKLCDPALPIAVPPVPGACP